MVVASGDLPIETVETLFGVLKFAGPVSSRRSRGPATLPPSSHPRHPDPHFLSSLTHPQFALVVVGFDEATGMISGKPGALINKAPPAPEPAAEVIEE